MSHRFKKPRPLSCKRRPIPADLRLYVEAADKLRQYPKGERLNAFLLEAPDEVIEGLCLSIDGKFSEVEIQGAMIILAAIGDPMLATNEELQTFGMRLHGLCIFEGLRRRGLVEIRRYPEDPFENRRLWTRMNLAGGAKGKWLSYTIDRMLIESHSYTAEDLARINQQFRRFERQFSAGGGAD